MEATQIILNPNDARQRIGRLWQTCQQEVQRALAPAETVSVTSPHEAARQARDSAMAGYFRMVVVGGGATAHGVVNGLMQLAESHRRRIKLGFLSLQRPDDWSRSTDFPRHFGQQLEVLRAAQTLRFDLGRVLLGEPGVDATVHYFLNGAGFGLLNQMRQALPEHRPGPRALLDALRCAADGLFGRAPAVRIEDGQDLVYQGPWVMGMAMVGRFYPLLGEVAPQADPLDGLLDLVWFDAGSRLALCRQLARLVLRRTPGGMRRACAERFRVESLGAPVVLDVDGEPVGRLPAEFSVVPKALTMIVPLVTVAHRKPAFAQVRLVAKGKFVGDPNIASGR